jgi:hypothetical protein
VLEVAAVRLRRDLEIDLRARDSSAHYRFNANSDPIEPEAFWEGLKPLRLQTYAHESA